MEEALKRVVWYTAGGATRVSCHDLARGEGKGCSSLGVLTVRVIGVLVCVEMIYVYDHNLF